MIIDREHSLCFSGHRPETLLKYATDKDLFMQDLSDCLYDLILDSINDGYTDFFSGMAQGVDLIASEIVLNFKEKNHNIKHHAVYPFASQSKSYDVYWQTLFMKVMTYSDTNNILSPKYVRGCYQKRNRYIVDHSSCLIAVFNGDYKSGTGQTIKYALKRNIPTKIIHISDPNLPIEIISPY